MAELEEGNAACRQEAAWVFLNMCQCGFEVHESLIPIMVDSGLLSAVCHNLDKQEEPGDGRLGQWQRFGRAAGCWLAWNSRAWPGGTLVTRWA